MKNENLDWTTEIRNEFYKNILDNYNLFESIEDGYNCFIQNKTKNDGRKKYTDFDKSFWEVRNN
jgi:hypothetical protein